MSGKPRNLWLPRFNRLDHLFDMPHFHDPLTCINYHWNQYIYNMLYTLLLYLRRDINRPPLHKSFRSLHASLRAFPSIGQKKKPAYFPNIDSSPHMTTSVSIFTRHAKMHKHKLGERSLLIPRLTLIVITHHRN